jgi:YbbR domain-containing protein
MITGLLRRVFRKNWGLKLFSLVLSVILWLALIPAEKISVEKALTLPLETNNIPPNLELVEKPLATVDVTVRAPNRLMAQIIASNPSVVVNLENATAYQQDYPLSAAMISLPAGAEVVRIMPNRIHLKLEETKSVMLKVVPDVIKDSLRPGYRLDGVEVAPDEIRVNGPASKLNEHDRVRTVPIDLTAYSQTTELEADLILPRPELRLAENQARVRVKLTIVRLRTPEPKPVVRR